MGRYAFIVIFRFLSLPLLCFVTGFLEYNIHTKSWFLKKQNVLSSPSRGSPLSVSYWIILDFQEFQWFGHLIQFGQQIAEPVLGIQTSPWFSHLPTSLLFSLNFSYACLKQFNRIFMYSDLGSLVFDFWSSIFFIYLEKSSEHWRTGC